MSNQRRWFFGANPFGSAVVMLTVVLAFTCGHADAQAVNSGEIRGTVTDPSGAVVPGVSVTILNTQTGVKTDVVTNEAGLYDALSLLPGSYSITFHKEGFNTLVRQGIDLQVRVITVNEQLAVGATSQSVEVSAQASLLRTETPDQGATLQNDVIMNLPNIGQNWTNFTQNLPGVTGSGAAISVNGTERYEGSFLSDGGNVILPRSNNLDSTILFESIAQVEVITANFNAQYGSGTAVFNQITKGGTNQFHGSAYEYDQNDFFNARSYFQKTVGRTRWNEYGGSVGGPVRRDKLFFFANYDSTISRAVSNGFTTYPTAAMRTGDFSYAGFMNSDGSPRLVYDPTSLANGVRTPFPSNKVPQTLLDPLALKILNFIPLPNTTPGTLNNLYVPLANQAGVVYSNYYYNRTSVNHPYTYLLKGDYAINTANRLSASMMRRKVSVITDPSYNEEWPANINDGITGGLTAQITDVWTLRPTMVNEFRASLIRQSIRNIPASKDKGYIAKLGVNYALGDVFPTVNIGGPIGGTSLGPGTSATMGETTYAPSDTFTWIHGKHIFKFGGQYERNADNGGNWGDINSTEWDFNPTFTTRAPGDSSSGLGFADFLTGKVYAWQAQLSPVVGIRMRAAQMFAQDDFKIKPNLTLSFGVRYEIQGGWSEVGNRIASFDPTITNPATNTPGAMWYAGNNGRTNLQANLYNTFLPRVGFVWTIQSKWSVRGAFGMFSHRWGADVYGVGAVRSPTAFYTIGSMTETDNINPVFQLSNPNPPINLFVPNAQTRTPAALNGQSVAYFPYHTPASKLYSWSFGLQRELQQGMIAEVSYIGNHGTGLSVGRDINQVPQALLGPGNAQPRRPYPNFQSIGAELFDNVSYYDGLQAALRRRFSKGLSIETNYTWSRNLVDFDSSGWAGQAGTATIQNSYDLAANYGLSNNDVRQMFKAVVVYQLPVGKGHTFMGNSAILDGVFGGWQASGVFIKQTGSPYTPTVSGANNTGSLAGTWYPNRIANGNLSDPTITKWFDPSAFTVPASYTFGNSGRNVLIGPGRTTLDFSMGKNFAISKVREGMQLQIRVDATNILNHACFSTPNSSIGSSSAGIITGTSVGGRFLQLGARLAF